jgi:hypothetical protein
MILVDLNQVMIANLMMQLGSHSNAELDENMLRHFVLNSLRSIRKKFSDEYGEMVICADGRHYWRRDIFPYYKAARRKARENSDIDWNNIFNTLNKIRAELDEFFPYKVIEIDKAEADDIIGTICHTYGTPLNSGEKILILSGDKDYIQLHKYANVVQYSPSQKKWVKHSDPETYLFEHIAKGDGGDGIPNVLSNDNCLVVGERQRPMTAKRLKQLENLEQVDENTRRNWHRNKKLVDLSETPEDLKEKILAKYHEEKTIGRSKLLDFFIQNRLKLLIENINDF